MSDYKMCKFEMETTINYNAQDKIAHVFTADATVQRKLDKLCSEHPEE